MTLKKTDHEIILLIRHSIDQLCRRMGSNYLFCETPILSFYPAKQHCDCGSSTTIVKTSRKTIATLAVGEFKAIETQTTCKPCQKIYGSDELRGLTPYRGKFGFDIIEYIGQLLFVQCRNELEIQAELAARNIPICVREIGFLGKRFIIYLKLAHQECQTELKQYMQSKGGYVLHMDGTTEGDSPHLFSCTDEISNIVLGNQKMPTEDSQYIVPLLQRLKDAYGIPVALVHDMGRAILKAVADVFPGVPDYICHFHFLRDLGKDLFYFEYQTIRKQIRSYNVRVKLNKTLKQLKAMISDDKLLWDSLERYLAEGGINDADELDPKITAYLLVAWVLEAGSACHGFGFPFDQPHLEFYLRLQCAHPVLERLKEDEGVSVLPLALLNRALADVELKKMVSDIQEKIVIFESLRGAMRIARVEAHQGLNDEGDEDIKTIESRVKRFRYSARIVALASSDTSDQKMVKQIDKYWDKLFADPIEVDTPMGKIYIQPQRTNNLMEQIFRYLKRDGRKRSGQHSLNKALKGMLADTPLVRNLSNPDYMAILLKGEKDLAARFASIDIEQVRHEEMENEKRWSKYPKRMKRIFKIPNLPQKLGNAA
jgi:hypothetical protein